MLWSSKNCFWHIADSWVYVLKVFVFLEVEKFLFFKIFHTSKNFCLEEIWRLLKEFCFETFHIKMCHYVLEFFKMFIKEVIFITFKYRLKLMIYSVFRLEVHFFPLDWISHPVHLNDIKITVLVPFVLPISF